MGQFSERGTRRIIDAVKRVESKPVSLVPTRHRPTKDIYPLAYIAKVTTEVTVFATDELGTGKVDLYKSNTDYEIESFKADADVYSLLDIVVAVGTWCFVTPNHQGILIITEVIPTGVCSSLAAIRDTSDIPGWSASTEQALTHDTSGCLKWVDIGACP